MATDEETAPSFWAHESAVTAIKNCYSEKASYVENLWHLVDGTIYLVKNAYINLCWQQEMPRQIFWQSLNELSYKVICKGNVVSESHKTN